MKTYWQFPPIYRRPKLWWDGLSQQEFYEEEANRGRLFNRRFEKIFFSKEEAQQDITSLSGIFDSLGVLYEPIALYLDFSSKLWHIQVSTLGRSK
jgi:hypothetical protein